MLKRLPSKNQRSKGVRVKHVLQICLLLGVCFWLVYQVKHSHDKKKEFDENGARVSIRKETSSDEIETLRLGRKDLPREDDVIENENGNEKPEEEEEEAPLEEEEKREDEEREEGEEDLDESKNEESEDGGGGDDEIDENDQERKDEDLEEESDEERIASENGGDVEDQVETETDTEGGGDRGSDDHEAREEHYRGDDASSEVKVTHEAAVEMKMSLGNSDENSVGTKSNIANVTAETLNSVSHVKKVDNNNSSLSSVDNRVLQSKQSNKQELPATDSSNNSTTMEVSTEAIDSSAETSNVTLDSSLLVDSSVAQNITTGENDENDKRALLLENSSDDNTSSENNQVDHNSTVSTETEHSDGSSNESTDSLSNEKALISNDEKVLTKEEPNSDVAQDEKSEEGVDLEKGSDDSIQSDPIDSTDVQVGQELNEARTDLGTLPELTSHSGGDNEEVAAE